MANSLDITWTHPIEDCASTPLDDITSTKHSLSKFGNHFVLELTQETFDTLMGNTQYIGWLASMSEWRGNLVLRIFDVDCLTIGTRDRVIAYKGVRL